MKRNCVFMKKKGQTLQMALASTVLAAMLLTGCGAGQMVPDKPAATPEPEESTNINDVFTGMYKADEPVMMMDAYTGALVVEGYRGITGNGGSYVMPMIDESIAGRYAESANEALNAIAVKALKTLDGSQGYAVGDTFDVDFQKYGTVELKIPGDSYGAIAEVYESYTGRVITPEEYNLLLFRNRGDQAQAQQYMLDGVEREYVTRAMYDTQLSPEGLQKTLELAKHRYYSIAIPVLDADGNKIDDMVVDDWDFREDYMYHSLEYFSYGRNDIPYLTLEIPGAVSVKENMHAAIASYDETKEGPQVYTEAGCWVSGRYMVFRLKMYDETVYQYRYFFLNLLTGQEETYQQVYANMGMDKQILSEQIRKLVDEDYQYYYENKSGKPFNWEHNEALYKRTMDAANADGVMVVPGYEGLLICYNAYVDDNGAPVQRELEIPYLRWAYVKDSVAIVTQESLAMYPGLESLFAQIYPTTTDVGYLNYGTWQCGDTVVIGIGWFDTNMNWAGYDTLCINSTDWKQKDFHMVMASAGMDAQMFETQLMTYLQSQPDFPGR